MSNLSVNAYLANGGAVNEDCNNFWDWFCSDSGLKNRGIALDKKVKALCDFGIIDKEKHCVSYKNNCPFNGKLYDSILVNDMNNESIYWIIPASGHKSNSGVASIYVYSSNKEFEFSSWKELKAKLKAEGLKAIEL